MTVSMRRLSRQPHDWGRVVHFDALTRAHLSALDDSVKRDRVTRLQLARHFASSEADTIHKEVCLCGLVSRSISAIFLIFFWNPEL
jgi:hypothetical protein